MEAGPEVSFAEMTRLQNDIADKIRKDADVEGVVSVVGVSALNPTPNTGNLKITLNPRSQRTTHVSQIIARLQGAVAGVPGMTVYFQPVQDVQISTRASRAQFQYTLVGASTKEVSRWSARLVDKLRSAPVLREVVSEAQDGGLRAFV
jgi:multidrug efflux pump